MDFINTHSLLKEATDKLAQTDLGLDRLSASILNDVIVQALHVYQNKLNVDIQDSVSGLLRTFKHKVSETIFNTANGWKLVNRDPVLFPRGCRFFYQKGESTVLVIEQDPQLRSLLFDPNILDQTQKIGQNKHLPPERIVLALPYVVFVIHFKKNMFQGLYCAWRTQPLRSLNDYLLCPLLPNIHEGHAVCMGHHWMPTGNSFVSQSESAISDFWNSSFNGDLGARWRDKHQIDNRLVTGRLWSQKSLEDPTFILSVGFDQSRKVEDLIDLITKYDEQFDEISLRHKLSETVDVTTEALFHDIMNYFKTTQFEKHYPKDITEKIKMCLLVVTERLHEFASVLQDEVEMLGTQIRLNPNTNIVPAGDYWLEYY